MPNLLHILVIASFTLGVVTSRGLVLKRMGILTIPTGNFAAGNSVGTPINANPVPDAYLTADDPAYFPGSALFFGLRGFQEWLSKASFSSGAGNLFQQDLLASMAAFDGTLVRQTNKTLSSSMALFGGSIAKQTNKILAASMSTFGAVLAEAIVFAKSLAASMATFDAVLAELFIPFVPPSAGQTIRNWFRRAF